jgi:hypothetical protein
VAVERCEVRVDCDLLGATAVAAVGAEGGAAV